MQPHRCAPVSVCLASVERPIRIALVAESAEGAGVGGRDALRHLRREESLPAAHLALPEMVDALRLLAESGELAVAHDRRERNADGKAQLIDQSLQLLAGVLMQLFVTDAAVADFWPPFAADSEQCRRARATGVVAKDSAVWPGTLDRSFRTAFAGEPVGRVVMDGVLQYGDQYVQRMPSDDHRLELALMEKIEEGRCRMPVNIDHAFRRQSIPGRLIRPFQSRTWDCAGAHEEIA